MRVYVTGGSGFLGRRIVAAAQDLGHEVLAPRSEAANLASHDSLAAWFAARAQEGRPIEAVVHSAAYYGGLNITMSEPAAILFKNLTMINTLFQVAAEAGVKKIVSVGSACAYPGDLQGDMPESAFWAGPLHDSVLGYGFTKKVQHVAQQVVYKQYGILGNHLILTNLYGEHDVFTDYRGHAIAVLIKRYVDAAANKEPRLTNWGDGSAVREFMHVADAAALIARAIDWPHDLLPVNVGTGIGTSIRELCDLLAEFSGYAGEVCWDSEKPNGVLRKVLDTRRLKALAPDFTPRSLRAGLQETVSWYRANQAQADERR